MLSLFRRITAPLRRQARLQRRVSTDKLEAEVAAVRAQLERRDGDMRRTLTDLISSTAEIAQVRSSSPRPHNPLLITSAGAEPHDRGRVHGRGGAAADGGGP